MVAAEGVPVTQQPDVPVLEQLLVEQRPEGLRVFQQVWESNDGGHVRCCAFQESPSKVDFVSGLPKFTKVP